MGKKDFRSNLSRIEEMEKEFKKKRKQIMVQCAHQNEKGKLKIRRVDNAPDGTYECKYCHVQFNINAININELKDAANTMHDAIQQLRAFSDPVKDSSLNAKLGEIDFNIGETVELYDRLEQTLGRGNGKKKNKDKRRNDDNGSYGFTTFIGGGKKKK